MRNTTLPHRKTVPAELGGKWIAWSSNGTRIVAHGETLDECEKAAEKAGEKTLPLKRLRDLKSASSVLLDEVSVR